MPSCECNSEKVKKKFHHSNSVCISRTSQKSKRKLLAHWWLLRTAWGFLPILRPCPSHLVFRSRFQNYDLLKRVVDKQLADTLHRTSYLFCSSAQRQRSFFLNWYPLKTTDSCGCRFLLAHPFLSFFDISIKGNNPPELLQKDSALSVHSLPVSGVSLDLIECARRGDTAILINEFCLISEVS